MFPYYQRQCPTGSVPYTIKAGDTLAAIARIYGTTVQDIINANPDIDPYYLRVGQQICIPLTMQIYPSCPTTNYYVVRPEDTLESIAAYFNITPQQLLYSNYGIDPTDLYVDQILCIPVAPPPVTVNVNVAERTLTVYRDGRIYRTYRIALENPASPIPRGTFTVLNKQVDPGVEMGARWIGLSEAGFGIHGTNTPEFIDVVSTGNSIVMSNEDVSELFNLVPVGTIVTIS
ncbi:MAG TPA: LysM peptidoglycan-binding domain-containing protein [Hungateiclostridium thermocellum]|jgi:L,D-transpeptidase ErfK/SrfK|uniref:Peptidoglycan-binding lysin domain-containing protein n=2 Tax=Acetivibrio thermocellus TaxID=1515 RepID=A3DJS4_ACET2|nr:LysM peptidoglycan-binding domain-containing protein [Acetivibrio thermocellus]CDG37493.1 ErfK/YbiS/YcfS/YnhG [Acetivibrio thermocellus BC1]ABN54203.1 Peptidoglycan-binding lysin domain-containing protein [Acetivibrio thermocellus ATCC 27405]ADU73641.1 Peptidoglycan-binding lysin domain [Acetivibrio thermocellus DSM 1313]ALX07569.1 Peptidoglycan-binding lysin domain-containing protein [Acetivibrio thermocellus AD2]ANV75309.1 Peptidoglycan-binding lysin domain-containing protein [Acetivibrio